MKITITRGQRKQASFYVEDTEGASSITIYEGSEPVLIIEPDGRPEIASGGVM